VHDRFEVVGEAWNFHNVKFFDGRLLVVDVHGVMNGELSFTLGHDLQELDLAGTEGKVLSIERSE
jgi:hypothetical protein